MWLRQQDYILAIYLVCCTALLTVQQNASNQCHFHTQWTLLFYSTLKAIITTKDVTKKKKIWFVKQRFQAEIHFMNLLKLDLDYAVWIWFAEILLHLEIFITLLFSPAAKAFKISPCRYPESSLAVSDKWRDWRQEKNVDNLWLWKKVSDKNAIM